MLVIDVKVTNAFFSENLMSNSNKTLREGVFLKAKVMESNGDEAESDEDQGDPSDPQMQYMCVDVTSPVPNLEKQTDSMWSRDIEIPANDSATIAFWSARYDPQIKIAKVLIQNASETLTRCRLRDPENSGSLGGLWVIGGGGSIGQIDWFDIGNIATLNVYNESNETALITVSALLYRDEGNACRYDSFIS